MKLSATPRKNRKAAKPRQIHVNSPLTLPAPLPGKAAHVKVDILTKINPDAVLLGTTVLTKMDNNPNFPSPLPSKEVVQAAIDGLATKMAAADVARRASIHATSEMNTARDVLNTVITQRGTYVDLVANGNPNVILSSGFQLRAAPSPVGDLDVPQNLTVDLNGTAGRMILTWDMVTNARSYNLQVSPANTAERTWTALTPSSSTYVQLDDMVIGQMYAFQVAAVGGASGQSAWSTEAIRMAA